VPGLADLIVVTRSELACLPVYDAGRYIFPDDAKAGTPLTMF